MHLQVSVKEYNEELKEFVENYVNKIVTECNGSISAEHGIGFLKAGALKRLKNPAALKLMEELKKTMDPNNILNPYKVVGLRINE